MSFLFGDFERYCYVPRLPGSWNRSVDIYRAREAAMYAADSVHVVPVNDLIEHEITEDCVCLPRAELRQGDDTPDRWIILHHSLDGRERTEPDRHAE